MLRVSTLECELVAKQHPPDAGPQLVTWSARYPVRSCSKSAAAGARAPLRHLVLLLSSCSRSGSRVLGHYLEMRGSVGHYEFDSPILRATFGSGIAGDRFRLSIALSRQRRIGQS